jgi:hypothetical protein
MSNLRVWGLQRLQACQAPGTFGGVFIWDYVAKCLTRRLHRTRRGHFCCRPDIVGAEPVSRVDGPFRGTPREPGWPRGHVQSVVESGLRT